MKLTTKFQLLSRLRMVNLYLHSLLRLHGVVLNQLSPGKTSTSPDIIRMVKSGRISAVHVARIWKFKNGYKILPKKIKEKRHKWIRRRRYETNIKMKVKEILWECVNCINLSQYRFQLRILENSVTKGKEHDLVICSLSRTALLYGVGICNPNCN